MDVATVVLALLAAVLVGDWINRFVPIPPPIVQIVLGVALAIGPLPSVELSPEIFFLVCVPPLLFLDGWRIPKRDLRRDGVTIVALALGLVVFTVVGVGFFIHWLIPEMPLPVAFALAAVLSPTDPIAVAAVAAGAPVPSRLMHILEGESLLNDATGLVCVRFAIIAALSGDFSLPQATLSFLWVAGGGAAIGIAITFAVTFIEARVLQRGERDPGAQTLFTLLIPFGVYLTAEAIHVSGILAAATAGIAMNRVEIGGHASPDIRMRRTAVWNTVQLALNGMIFVLLGEQLPDIFKQTVGTAVMGTSESVQHLILYVVAISVALLALRFAWVWVSLRLVIFRAGRRGETREGLTWHLVATTTVAGVKGAITLAGVLTLPKVMPNGSAFPARDLAIFLSMGVILLSLALASVLMPVLLRSLRLPPEPASEAEEDRARELAADAATKAIRKLRDLIADREAMHEGHEPSVLVEAAGRAMERYDRRATFASSSEETRLRHRELLHVERRLRIAGLRAERETLFQLRRQHKIEDGLLRRLVREIDLLESRFNE